MVNFAIDDFEETTYKFNSFINLPRFEYILALFQTSRKHPPCKDQFWEVRQFIERFPINRLGCWFNVAFE